MNIKKKTKRGGFCKGLRVNLGQIFKRGVEDCRLPLKDSTILHDWFVCSYSLLYLVRALLLVDLFAKCHLGLFVLLPCASVCHSMAAKLRLSSGIYSVSSAHSLHLFLFLNNFNHKLRN